MKGLVSAINPYQNTSPRVRVNNDCLAYTLNVAFHAVDCRLLHSPASGQKKYESRAGLIGHACCPQWWGRHAIYCATIHRRAEIQDQAVSLMR